MWTLRKRSKSVALVGVATLFGGALVAVAGVAVAGVAAARAEPDPVARADRLLWEHPAAIAAADGEAYSVFRTIVDRNGAAHVRYNRTYHGLRVKGGDFIIHTEADGSFAGSSIGLSQPLNVATTPRISAAGARTAAPKSFAGAVDATATPELIIDASDGRGRLAWDTVVSGRGPDGQTPSRLHVISDANTGDVLGSHDEIEPFGSIGQSLYSGVVFIDTTETGSTFSMIDSLHGNGTTCDLDNRTGGACPTFTDERNVWGDHTVGDEQTAAADAHYGAALTFDYFKNVHGRNGIFGNGAGVRSRVHYGNGFANAFWDGAQMTYGDGAGNAHPLVSIDIAGHEMTHGITENLVSGGLTYSGESGGLNEATSDIFGTMVEFSANNGVDPGDYTIGEKVDINGNGTPLRYMYNPALDGRSFNCWFSGVKDLDPHYSSGVANHFFFNLAEGSGSTRFGTSPTCPTRPAARGIGRAKAAAIWYRALDAYFVSNTSYVNTGNPSATARRFTAQAATDLYGACSAEFKAVLLAWSSVNVPGSEACPADQTILPWYNDATGETQNWFMNAERVEQRGTVIDEAGQPILVGLPWSIAAVRDMDGDGSNDFVWHNAASGETQIWFMNRQRIVRRATALWEDGTPALVIAPWRIVGAGDLNRDGLGDIVWHHDVTNETHIWFMDRERISWRGGALDESGNLIFVGDPWRIVGAAGNNFGTGEIVWYNSATGETQIWFMNGQRISRRATVLNELGNAALVGPPYHIVNIADLDRNASADVVWHNDQTNETRIWYLNGERLLRAATALGEDGQPAFVGLPWHIV